VIYPEAEGTKLLSSYLLPMTVASVFVFFFGGGGGIISVSCSLMDEMSPVSYFFLHLFPTGCFLSSV